MKIYLRAILYVSLLLAIVLAAGSYLATHLNHAMPADDQGGTAQWDSKFGWALLVTMALFLGHALILRYAGRLTTHSGRRLVLALFMLIPLVIALIGFTILYKSSRYTTLQSSDYAPLVMLLFTPVLLLLIPGMIVYSIPSSWLATLPLLLHYLLLASFFMDGEASPMLILLPVAYLPLSGYLFPKHRRIKEYWKPARLPRLRREGFTLIELLIVVAIVAIFSAGILSMSSGTRQLLERQANWRAATALAEEQLDLLRAGAALPALGRHPVDPVLARYYHFAGQAEIEVRAGPGERWREVWVNVRLRGDGNDKDVSLAAILPVAGQGEGRP